MDVQQFTLKEVAERLEVLFKKNGWTWDIDGADIPTANQIEKHLQRSLKIVEPEKDCRTGSGRLEIDKDKHGVIINVHYMVAWLDLDTNKWNMTVDEDRK